MRLAVVKLSSLGDILHALPAVAILQRELQAEVDWICHPAFVSLVESFTCVSSVIAYPRKNWSKAIGAYRAAVRRGGPYDLAVDLQGLFKSALALSLLPARRKILPAIRREGVGVFPFEKPPAPGHKRHAIEHALDSVRYLGYAANRIEFPVSFPAYVLPALAGPLIGLAPWSRWPAKNWPTTKFVHLARALHRETGGSLVLLGGPEDLRPAESLQQQIGEEIPVLNLAGKTSMSALGSVLQQLDLLVTNDSGPMHLAAALGLPQVALFGPTNPALTGPYGEKATILQADADLIPPGKHLGYRNLGSELIDKIEVDTVLEAALALPKRDVP